MKFGLFLVRLDSGGEVLHSWSYLKRFVWWAPALSQPWKWLRDWKIVNVLLNYLHLSTQEHLMWWLWIWCEPLCMELYCASISLHISMHSRATFWLMSTPIQHKINWFHSRRLGNGGKYNSTPHPHILGNGVCECACVILNQQKIQEKEDIFCLFV